VVINLSDIISLLCFLTKKNFIKKIAIYIVAFVALFAVAKYRVGDELSANKALQQNLTLEVSKLDPKEVIQIKDTTETAKKTSFFRQKSMLSDQVLGFANDLMGTTYRAGGKTPRGFDCSGFTYYVFGQHGIQLPRSSKGQIKAGRRIAYEKAKKGDLVVFTGTDATKRIPGHVGIVLTNQEDTLQFIHSSSNGGVKINHIEGSFYEKRFLEVRRVIE